MARTRSILRAVWRAFRRDQKSASSLAANNMQYLALAMLFLGDPMAVLVFYVVVAAVLLLPLSADPLRTIPRSRLLTWPLGLREIRILRVLSPWLNPITWILAGLAVWRRLSIGLWLLVASPSVIRWVVPRIPLGHSSVLWRVVPRLPGPMGLLVRKNLRQLFSTLDFWAALAVAVPAFIWRALGLFPREAAVPFNLLLVLALSTCAQSLFGLDGSAGVMRYRLLPARGWQILAAKDFGFLLIAIILSVPLSPVCGATAAFTALACGHSGSVLRRRIEERWRFQTSPSFASSIAQILLMTSAGSAAVYWNPVVLAIVVLAWLWSLRHFGRAFERI